MEWTEDLLFKPIAAHFRSKGYKVYREVLVARKWVDLLAVGNELVAVELKIRDWRTAIRQAMSYQLGTNYSLVAMPLDHVFTALRFRDIFEREGVGLMAVSTVIGNVRTLIEPQPSPRLLPFVLDKVLTDRGRKPGKPLKQRKIPDIKLPSFE